MSRSLQASVWAACVAGVAAAMLQAQAPPPSRPRSIETRPLWTGAAASQVSRAASPDGRYVSLTPRGQHGAGLAVHDLRSGVVHNVIETPTGADGGEVETSSISPDNQWIAYAWNRGADGYDLRVVPLEGGSPRTVVAAVPWLAPFAWMPDGKRVLVVTSVTEGRPAERDAVEIVELATGARRLLFRFSFPYGAFPSLSPDGRLLAMQQRRGTFLTREIHIQDIESGARTVYRHGDDDREPVWLRDGTGLVFQSQAAGTSGLWWQPFTSGKAWGSARLLLEGFEGDLLNASSRDGSLPFLSNRGKSAIFVADFDAKTGQVRGRPRPLTEHVEGESLAPAWSPDGMSLALVSMRTLTGLPQRGMLVILTGAKTMVHPLDFGVARGTGPAWSADGKSLFLPGSDPGSTTENVERLYRVDAITGESAAVPIAHVVNTKLRVGRSFPVLTPDSRLAYVSRARELFRVDVATGERAAQGIVRWAEPEVLYSLALSPDGRQLAFGLPRRDSTPRLAMMPAGGGTPEILHPGPELNLRGFGGI